MDLLPQEHSFVYYAGNIKVLYEALVGWVNLSSLRFKIRIALELLAMPILSVSKEVSRGLRDLLFPRDCLLTGVSLGEERHRYFSEAAAQQFYLIRSPFCKTCGFPFFGEVIGARQCPCCVTLDPVFKEGRSLLLGRDAGRVLVHELKYRTSAYVLSDIETLLQDSPEYLAFLSQATLVPVPLHPKRERQRGFNQSLLLTQVFAQVLNGAPIAHLLCRRKNTLSQTRLSQPERQANVKNAFALRRGAALDSSIRYLLIDDVFTTGATLNACAQVLKAAGASHVDVATLAHG